MAIPRTVLDGRPYGAQSRKTCWYAVRCIDEEGEGEERPEGDEDVGGVVTLSDMCGQRRMSRMQHNSCTWT